MTKTLKGVDAQVQVPATPSEYTWRKCWDRISADLKPIYTAAGPAEARLRYEEFAEQWRTSPTRPSSGCETTPGRSSYFSCHTGR